MSVDILELPGSPTLSIERVGGLTYSVDIRVTVHDPCTLLFRFRKWFAKRLVWLACRVVGMSLVPPIINRF